MSSSITEYILLRKVHQSCFTRCSLLNICQEEIWKVFMQKISHFLIRSHFGEIHISQKTVILKIPKLCEFNYKLIHNLVPCAKLLAKWNKIKCDKCEYCGEMETTKHMLFECTRTMGIWNTVSELLKLNITWKHVVCGFPKYTCDVKVVALNYIISII